MLHSREASGITIKLRLGRKGLPLKITSLLETFVNYGVMAFTTTTFSINDTQHHDTQHNSMECRWAQCRYTECRGAVTAVKSFITSGPESEAAPAPTQRPRLFKPKQQRPPLLKNLKDLQDQQRSESQLVNGKPEKEATPPRKRFRPTAAPAATTPAADAEAESETSTSEPKPSRPRGSAQRSFALR
jgi:hypothetical protein